MSSYFDTARASLDATLPQWWANGVPGSQLDRVVAVAASVFDDLAAAADGVLADQRIQTAGLAALINEWAPIYGAAGEQLPNTTEALRAYLLIRAGEDGSARDLREALLALMRTPANASGVKQTFPAGGAGLHFPADGSGLRLFQGVSDERLGGLHFPADGSGLHFPADGSGLHFAASGRLEITEHPAEKRFDVTVRSWLAFDRAAFARAVTRFRRASDLPPTITETAS